MAGGKGKIEPKDNTGGFQKNPQNINRKGRPKKNYFRDELLEMTEHEKGYPIEFPRILNASIDSSGEKPIITIIGEWGKVVKHNGEIDHEKKIAYISINLPTVKRLSADWLKDAESRHSRIRLKARADLVERIDGKPDQHVTAEGDFNATIVINDTGETLPRSEDEIDDEL